MCHRSTGLRAFQRIKFTDGKPWFKAAWYVYRANHGQWNSVWGNKDNGPRSARSLDLRGLISEEDQRQFSKVTIGAFMEATLHGKSEYSADVPRSPCRRRVASEDDVHHAISGKWASSRSRRSMRTST
jgi:hypothetical protein